MITIHRCRIIMCSQVACLLMVGDISLIAGDPQTSQLPSGTTQNPQSQGASTAGAHSAVLDAEKRPITAGGFAERGTVVFEDVASAAGLTHWRHQMGRASCRERA